MTLFPVVNPSRRNEIRNSQNWYFVVFILQAEQEQRYALKKELDAKNNSESMFQLGNLALSIQGLSESGTPSSMGSEGDEESPVFKKVGEGSEAGDGDGSGQHGQHPDESAPAEDLFSEIHLGQVKKLEKHPETTEAEKISLSSNVKEIQALLDSTSKEAVAQKAKVAELLAYLSGLDTITAHDDTNLFKIDAAKIGDVNASLEKHRQW